MLALYISLLTIVRGSLVSLSNTLVTPAPHIQGKNIGPEHLDPNTDPKLPSKQGKFGSYLGAICSVPIFLPCMWGLGLQEESPVYGIESAGNWCGSSFGLGAPGPGTEGSRALRAREPSVPGPGGS